MRLHDQLLAQAEHLARLEPRRPRQASLRRAISTAYYALFHMILHESTRILIAPPELRDRFCRAFDHSQMKSVSRAFCDRNIPEQYTDGLPVPQELKDIAKIFVQLQEARHEADYNVGAQYSRLHAKNLVGQARLAFDLWEQIREDPAIRMYAASLLVKPRSR